MSDTDQGRPEAQRRIEERDEQRLSQLDTLLKREAARDAGLDLSNPQTKYFVDTFTGDPMDLPAKAREYGFLSQVEQQQQAQAEVATQGLERTTGAASQQGGGGSGQSTLQSTKNQALTEKAAKLKFNAEHRLGDRQDVLDFAREAGVPFVDEDQ